MSWAQPAWLILLAAVPVLALVLVVAAALHRRKLRRVLSAEIVDRVLPRGVRLRRALRDVAVVLGFVGIVLALAEPRFDKQVRTLKTRGTDLVVLLDLSRSMDARDVDPSRLERARREIADLGRQMEGDRVGLVVFAGGAFPRLPLTADFKAVQLVVSETTTDVFDTQGSNLGAALQAGIDLLDRSQEHAGQAVLVLSDGEIHQPDEALAAAKVAADKHVPVFVMGIGDEPAPVPLPDGRFLQWKGQTVTSTPDFDLLKQVAKLTGGAFVQSSAGSRDMEQLYGEIRRSVKAVERNTQQRESWRSAFQVPLGIAVMLLLGGGWLGEGRRRYGAAAALLALALASAPAQAADPLLEADQLYRSGKYPQAAEKLVELSLELPDDPEIQQRLGSARYRAGDFEGAARAFDRAAELAGEDGTDALYNSGNAHYLAGRLEDARARYEEVLERNPDHDPAKLNHGLVTKEIEARRAPQPPPPPSGGGEDQEQQDGQDQGDPKQEQPKPGQNARPSQGDPGSQDPSQPPPQPEDPKQEGDRPSQDRNGEQGGTSDEPPDQQGSSPAVDPDQVGEPTDEPTAASGDTTSDGDAAGPITSGQAHRLLDSVEEGNQRIVVQGRPEQEPW